MFRQWRPLVLQETVSDLEALRDRESRLSEQQQELSRRMASMVQEYDEDKREALERYDSI